MASLSAIRKQIQRLEAEAERITKQEMSGAIAKIKSLMSEFGVTLEHLSGKSASVTARRAASKKVASPKRAGAGVARYADPKSGKTWTGFGRAPTWIAGAKDRDAFLIGAAVAEPEEAAPVKRAKKAVAAPAVPAAAKKVVKAAKKAPRKAVAAAKKVRVAKKSAAAKKTVAAAPAEPAATKKATAKKAAAKKAPAKKAPAKKASAKKASRKNAASKAAANSVAPKPATGDGAAAAAPAQ